MRLEKGRLEAKVTKLEAMFEAAKNPCKAKIRSPEENQTDRQIGKKPAQIGKSEEQLPNEELKVLTDAVKLRKLLKTKHVTKKLTCLTDVALRSTTLMTRRDKYRPLSDTINDGFEVSLGPVPYAAVC